MRVYVLNMQRRSDGFNYVAGVYENEDMAKRDAKTFHDAYEPIIVAQDIIPRWDSPTNDDDDIDLQQQVEALQAYVDVMQNYVLTLKDAMMILFDMPDIRRAIGEKVTQRLRKDLAEGRRSTFDDEMRKYIKEK
jgi:hypothetical protein